MSRKAARKPHNTLPIIEERLRYCEFFRHWSEADFKTLRFSDEKHWGAEPQRTVWVRRRVGATEREKPENIQYDAPQIRSRKKIVRNDLLENDDDAGKDLLRCHCWGAISWNFKSKLVWYETESKNGKMNKSIYVEKVLKDEVLTWAPGQWILEQDRDSGHGWYRKKISLGVSDGSSVPRCMVNKWFPTHGIRFLFNCADSPDLAIIENVWKYISQKLQALDYVPESVDALKEVITRLWDELPQAWINIRIVGGIDEHGRRVAGMRERWDDVKAANGDQTGH
jgi:hypothetical protein